MLLGRVGVPPAPSLSIVDAFVISSTTNRIYFRELQCLMSFLFQDQQRPSLTSWSAKMTMTMYRFTRTIETLEAGFFAECRGF